MFAVRLGLCGARIQAQETHGRKKEQHDEQTALLIPVVPEQFGRVGSADGAVAAAHVIGWAELVAAPANPLWVFGMKGRLGRFGLFLVHDHFKSGVARRTS
jgi:hypothetical protein